MSDEFKEEEYKESLKREGFSIDPKEISVINFENKGLPVEEIRKAILNFEDILSNVSDVQYGDVFPLKHTFADGIYVREITIPANMVLTGKIHKHEHPNFLMSGEVVVITESGGQEHLKGPLSMISPPGTKRILHTLSECVWITVHANPNNETDLEKIEDYVIAKSYEEYEEFKLEEQDRLENKLTIRGKITNLNNDELELLL